MKIVENRFEKYTDATTFSKLVIDYTVPKFLDKIHANYASNIAVGALDKKVTFEELDKDIKKTCTVLKNNNISVKSNVGVICGNNYDFVKTSLGVMAYGACATLLPFQLDDQTIFGCCMRDCKLHFIF